MLIIRIFLTTHVTVFLSLIWKTDQRVGIMYILACLFFFMQIVTFQKRYLIFNSDGNWQVNFSVTGFKGMQSHYPGHVYLLCLLYIICSVTSANKLLMLKNLKSVIIF